MTARIEPWRSPGSARAEPVEVEVEPTVAGRIARWTERARILRGHVEAARADHASLDFGFGLVERDSSIGGGLLAGALAYRLFVLAAPDGAPVRLRPRALRGHRRQEPEQGRRRRPACTG